MKIKTSLLLFIAIFNVYLYCHNATIAYCQPVGIDTYSNAEIADAIYKAEGAAKATYAYGIRSIPYKDKADARRICLNTIRNNKKRFLKQSKYKDFIVFLGSRYCPIGCDNDNGTNKYWVKNVMYFLERR